MEPIDQASAISISGNHVINGPSVAMHEARTPKNYKIGVASDLHMDFALLIRVAGSAYRPLKVIDTKGMNMRSRFMLKQLGFESGVPLEITQGVHTYRLVK